MQDKMQVRVELSQLHLNSQKSSISMVLNNLNKVLESDLGEAKLLKILKSKQRHEILNTSYNSRRIDDVEYVICSHGDTNLLGATSDKPETQSVSNSSHISEVHQHIQFSSSKKSNSDITNWSLHRKGYNKKNGTLELRRKSSPVYIGRSNDCNVQCLAGNISRRHCKLICQTTNSDLPEDCDSEWSIQDMDSMTGTYLNEEKLLKYKDYPLSNNDIVTLARSDSSPQDVKDKYTFVYQVVSPQTNSNALVLYKKAEDLNTV